MSRRIIYLIIYFFFWFVYFLFFKAVFLIYHSDLANELEITTISGIFLYGSQLDLAFSAYISFIPFLLVTVSSAVQTGRWIPKILLTYTTVMVIFMTILCSTDLELFRVWGFRLDSTPLMYLNTPTEMLISVGASPILILVLLNTMVNLLFCFAYRKILHPITLTFSPPALHTTAVYALATLSLIIIMRGGFQKAPIQAKRVYFSQKLFANQAAVNVPWNFFYSIGQNGEDTENPYQYMETGLADSIIQSLYPEKVPAAGEQLLKSSNPNIVLIIWESLTAKVVEDLGGIPGVTPQFQKLSREGLFFKRVFASGDRSDKGIVAILSGYPAQPITSIINTPEKANTLPNLAGTFRKAGYTTSFYYGGDLEFAKLKSYLLSGGFDKLIGIENFKKEQLKSKWGAHDAVVFEKVLNDIDAEKGEEPFFKTIFTLSSHEPFDIPVSPRFPGKSVTNLFLSALSYTDNAFGDFIREAKTKAWYENTLFIVIADHGHTYPGNSQVYEPEKFHIPMLWLGGALKTKARSIPQSMSQTDLAATLLGQLPVSAREYQWSKNIFHPKSKYFAPYYFKDGIGFVTDSSYLSFDNVGGKLIEQQGATDSIHLIQAKAHLQMSYGDYLKK